MRLLLPSLLTSLLLFVACSGPAETPTPDSGSQEQVDAGVHLDAGQEPQDAGTEQQDAGTEDAGVVVPAAGFGAISGECGVLDTELTSPDPFYFLNHIDFGTDPYDDADLSKLTLGGQEIIADGNAGGSSILSEVFSYELLERCEGARLLKTETEVLYSTAGAITDLLVEIDGLKVGVSVTRAVAFPFEDPYTVAQAKTLLEKKLQGILQSSANVAPEDKWVKQILYVIAYADGHAASLQAALEQIDPAIKADTIVMVSVSDGDDAFIY